MTSCVQQLRVLHNNYCSTRRQTFITRPTVSTPYLHRILHRIYTAFYIKTVFTKYYSPYLYRAFYNLFTPYYIPVFTPYSKPYLCRILHRIYSGIYFQNSSHENRSLYVSLRPHCPVWIMFFVISGAPA